MRRKKKGLFSRLIVVFCVLEMTFMQLWAFRIASHNSLLTTGLLTANHAVFGGELLLLCLKRIFADKDKKNKKVDKEQENDC